MNKIKSSENIFSIFSPSMLEKNYEGKEMNLVQNIHPLKEHKQTCCMGLVGQWLFHNNTGFLIRYYNDLDLRRIEEMSGSNPGDEDGPPRCRWFNCKIVQDIQLFCDLSKEISDRKHYENKEIRRFRGYDYR